jgi:sugar lactone lactonase YvrE
MRVKVGTVVPALLVAFSSLTMLAQRVVTVAGGYVADGVPATSSSLSGPEYAAFDAQGNLYITDSGNNRIRRVDTAGKIFTIAGNGVCGFTGDGGPASKAKVCGPSGLAIGSDGSILFADGGVRVRKIDPTGKISTVAGNGTTPFCGDGGPALSACINPSGISLAGTTTNGMLYIADSVNNRIREVSFKTGIIKTVAGSGKAGYAGDSGPARKAELHYPASVVADPAAHALWISDEFNSVIREVSTKTGIITTFFGKGVCGNNLQSLCNPVGVVLDNADDVYVTDSGNSRILQITSGTNAATLAAGACCGFNGDGIPATSAAMYPLSTAFDSAGNLFIVDNGNNRIRKGSGSQNISTVAGGYIGDGRIATRADLRNDFFTGISFDGSNNFFLADYGNNRVRKVASNGTISTFAGTGITGSTGNGGAATSAELVPTGVVAFGGSVYISDGPFVRKVDANGTITTLAQIFGSPNGLAVDSVGNVYAAVWPGSTVWKITPQGSATVVAGVQGQGGYNGDGIPATQALLTAPTGVAVDSSGNLYIADWLNNRIRKVDTSGIISTVAGDGTCGFSGDGGPATAAMICLPVSVAVDSGQNLYIGDTYNGRVRKISGGTITTIAGTGKFGYNGNGLGALRTNLFPSAVAVGPSGDLYFFDLDGARIRKIQ